MFSGEYIFSQVMDHLSMHTFRKCVEQYSGNRYVSPSIVLINLFAWPSVSLHIEKVYAILKFVFELISPNSTTSESEEEYLVTHSRMLIKHVIGAFMLILLML